MEGEELLEGEEAIVLGECADSEDEGREDELRLRGMSPLKRRAGEEEEAMLY